MTFHIDPRRLRKIMDEKEVGVIEATRIERKEEALRRLDCLNATPGLKIFLRDLVEELL